MVYTGGSFNDQGGNGWHVGALRLPIDDNNLNTAQEVIHYSGIYVGNSGPTTQP
jgi:hypothetical protein